VGAAGRLFFSADGAHVHVGYGDATLRTWDLLAVSEVGGIERVHGLLGISPDGRKAEGYFRFRGYRLGQGFSGFSDNPSHAAARSRPARTTAGAQRAAASVAPLCPSLVYGRITGWGQTGPRARQAGHDLNYVALSGALHYASPPGQPPAPPPTLLGDIGGGALYLVIGLSI
jgi:hypothetical protein